MYEYNYRDGKTDGKAEGWHYNRQKSTRRITRMGWKRENKNSGYGMDRNRMNIITKMEGKQVEWYENGQKRSEDNYKNGEREGKQEGWYDNGQKMYEYNCKDGTMDGKQEKWHDNGQKEYERNYRDGKMDRKANA